MNAEKIFGENVYVNLDEVIETVYQCRGLEADREWKKRWLEPLESLSTIEVSEDNEPTWEQVKEYCFKRNFAIVGRETLKEYLRGFAEVSEDAIRCYEFLKERIGSEITDNAEEFEKWFERMVFHVRKCNEYYSELKTICEDCISREMKGVDDE